MKREHNKSAALLGLAHFFVDFACTGLLTLTSGWLPYSQVVACALIYNGMAFAFQLPIGALGDCFRLRRGLAAAGCLLVALGAWIPQPLVLCLVIGLGNACFHVGGGRETLKRGGGLAAQVGKFVAPGAIGIFLGPRLASLSWIVKLLAPLVLVGFAAVLALTRKEAREMELLTVDTPRIGKGRRILVMGCMFLTVLLRSYMGTVLRYPILSDTAAALCFTLCVFGGKYFGGILGDKFGLLRFSGAAQMAATVLFALSLAFPILAFPAIFLFNTTMPITAAGLYRCLPRYPGTMFGLTTFALYLGVIPKLLNWPNQWFTWWGLGLLSLISTVLLLGGLVLGKGGAGHGKADCAVAAEIPGTDAAS